MTDTARIAHDEDGIRVDRWFKRHYPALTHGRLEKLLRTGQVRLDGKRVKIRRPRRLRPDRPHCRPRSFMATSKRSPGRSRSSR